MTDHPANKTFRLPALSDGEREALLETGICLCNQGRWLESHEAFEMLWRTEAAPHRDVYKAMVQIVAALHHAKLGNFRGANRLFGRAWELLAPHVAVDCSPAGIDLSAVAQWLRPVVQNRKEHPSGMDFTTFYDTVPLTLARCPL
ncbi:DUF309 domain-containing protein [Desulfovibrio mangrovi]|uniref:DUF309 domain-containing protein n=1 Tax=Desulfovibrio mangrovi TaxID=2976983 RepID=UPI0022455F3D|nr:DUF309 domain-containing protein [Desulfovibrio mangrovi]UZP66370.1 DUF309 domain-containing protein [Desulfovibrio mangrovi]